MTPSAQPHEHHDGYLQAALAVLKEKGYRITGPRRMVAGLLSETDEALNANEIRERLAGVGQSIDLVSVYRILDCLHENGLIHRILATGKVIRCHLEHEDHCHREQSDHCHHLLVCDQCNCVSEIHCPGIETLVKRIETDSGFVIRQHRLEFTGLCPDCA
ncbi:MAG: Fur family transcriptional regulator [Candidatus Melainabacteria bacterium]